MHPTKFLIEIYKPESTTQVEFKFVSSTPFMPISRGDIINPMGKKGSHVFRVTNVEHFIMKKEKKIEHKIGIYTMAVKDTHELRTI